MKTDMIDTREMDKQPAFLFTRDQMVDKIYTILSEPPLSMEKNDRCYVRVVGNHVEIGRAKIILEE